MYESFQNTSENLVFQMFLRVWREILLENEFEKSRALRIFLVSPMILQTIVFSQETKFVRHLIKYRMFIAVFANVSLFHFQNRLINSFV